MIVDAHGHYTQAPPQLRVYRGEQVVHLARPKKARLNVSDEQLDKSLQANLARMAELGVDCTLLSPRAGSMGHDFGGELTSLYWTQANNDILARVHSMYPGKFIPMCQLPQTPGVGPANCLPELERCVEELGFVGCLINPDVSGGLQPFTPSLADEWWYPLWEKMTELDVPGLIHASSTQNPVLHLEASHYINIDTAAVVELCRSRVFEDFPSLKLIIPHGGGAIPFHWARYRALHLREGLPPFEDAIKKLYFDTTLYDQAAIEFLIRRIGPDQLLFGSEAFGTGRAVDPSTGRNFDHTVRYVQDIDWLSDADREKIFEGNARKLFTRAKWPA
jgi:4-oxalmesaconate hydratase